MGNGLPELLRFGVICEGTTLPAWQAQVLEDLLSVDDVRAALLIVNEAPIDKGLGSKLWRWLRRPRRLWTLYYRAWVARRSRAIRPVDLGDRLDVVPVVRHRTRRGGGYSEYPDPAVVEEIRGHELDFILHFGFGIIRGDILDAARFGVWRLHHGDDQRYRGGPPCLWEVDRGDPTTSAVLQRLTQQPEEGVVLHKGFLRTVKHSYVRTLDSVCMGGADFPARVCKDLLSGAGAYVGGPPTRSRAPAYGDAGGARTTLFLVKLASRFVVSQFRGLLRRDQWNVGVLDAPIHELLDGRPKRTVEWFPSLGRTRYLADPFLLSNGKGLAVLAEDYDYRTRKGAISVLAWGSDGSFSPPRHVLTPDTHASYPFVTRHDGALYCVPEQMEARRVDLFRATEYLDRWMRVATLIEDFAALDPTLFLFQRRWWLLCTDGDRGSNAKLHIWHAPELFGPWEPHAANPVKTDVRSSRPAGTPFVHQGALYRPAQDASETYGGRVILNRILRLTPTEFAEESVAAVEPDPEGPYPHGMHTVAAAGDFTLVDGKRSRFIWPAFRSELAARIRRVRAR